MNIVGCHAITSFVLMKIVGPSKNHVLLSFVFSNIVGPSFILTPPAWVACVCLRCFGLDCSGHFSELYRKSTPEIPVSRRQHQGIVAPACQRDVPLRQHVLEVGHGFKVGG